MEGFIIRLRKWKIISLIGLALILSCFSVHAISDSTGDVYYYNGISADVLWELYGERDHVDVTDASFSISGSDISVQLTVKDSIASHPKESVLSNYPNPFGANNPTTTITYYLEESGSKVSLRIFDQFGNLIRIFNDLSTHQGLKPVIWDGTNDRLEQVANGGYFGVLTVDGKKHKRKIAVIR